MSFVYLFRRSYGGAYKIGFSTAFQRRLKQVRAEQADPNVEIITWAPGTMKDEARLHREFQQSRADGEWFFLDSAALDQLRIRFDELHQLEAERRRQAFTAHISESLNAERMAAKQMEEIDLQIAACEIARSEGRL